MLRILLLLIFCFGFQTNAQFLNDVLDLKNPKAFYLDELSNIYVIQKDNSVFMYNSNGDSLGAYQNIQDGDLKFIDAKNPLKLLCFYPDFSKIVFLDKMLSVKGTIQLLSLGYNNIGAVATAQDGNVWLFDEDKQQLFKIDEQGKVFFQSEDIRSLTLETIYPKYMVEDRSKVYIADQKKGIFVFDRYANFLNSILIEDMENVQVYRDLLFYKERGGFYLRNFKNGKTQKLKLPKGLDFIDAKIDNIFMYSLYKNHLLKTEIK